jgi:hypothetical protein
MENQWFGGILGQLANASGQGGLGPVLAAAGSVKAARCWPSQSANEGAERMRFGRLLHEPRRQRRHDGLDRCVRLFCRDPNWVARLSSAWPPWALRKISFRLNIGTPPQIAAQCLPTEQCRSRNRTMLQDLGSFCEPSRNYIGGHHGPGTEESGDQANIAALGSKQRGADGNEGQRANRGTPAIEERRRQPGTRDC